MQPYAWVIDKDHIAEVGTATAVATSGPRRSRADLSDQLKTGEGTAFKMLDDDGELYYEGRIVGEYDGFEPLDDFGMPNAGCTSIEYRNPVTGAWEQL